MDFGQHAITRRIMVSFMDFFSKIYIEKYSSTISGYVTRKVIRVPIQFASRDKWLEIYKSSSSRKAMDPSIKEKNPIEMQWILPRIGVQMISMNYDSQRKLIKTQQVSEYNSEFSSSGTYTPAPYNIDVDVYVISKTLDDNLQIMEQIVPFFSPGMSLNVKVYDDEISDSVSVVLSSITQDIPVDMSETEDKFITFIYTFSIKANYYAPKKIYGYTPDMYTNLSLGSIPASGDINQYNFDSGVFSKFSDPDWYNIFNIPASSSVCKNVGYPSEDVTCEYYLDTISGKLYKKINGEWVLIGSLPNIPGSYFDGTWYLEDYDPIIDLGVKNDYWLNRISGDVFRKNSEWNFIFSIGPNKTILEGVSNPSNDIGVPLDFYLNKTTGTLFLKDLNNNWIVIFTSGIVKYPGVRPLIYNIKSNVYSAQDYIEIDQKWIESQKKIEQKLTYYEANALNPNPFV